jgi:hypothetical protein
MPLRNMPGYRELPHSLTGEAADNAREAARLEQAGDRQGAVQLYEAALAAALRESPEVPAFLCGRLAMLYRTLGRHADEVALLEHYRDSQLTDEARTRFDARRSKAIALAVKNQPRDSTALASVRAIRSASESRSLRRVAPDGENRKLG